MLELNVPHPGLASGRPPIALQLQERADTQVSTQLLGVQLQVSETPSSLRETAVRSDSSPAHP